MEVPSIGGVAREVGFAGNELKVLMWLKAHFLREKDSRNKLGR